MTTLLDFALMTREEQEKNYHKLNKADLQYIVSYFLKNVDTEQLNKEIVEMHRDVEDVMAEFGKTDFNDLDNDVQTLIIADMYDDIERDFEIGIAIESIDFDNKKVTFISDDEWYEYVYTSYEHVSGKYNS